MVVLVEMLSERALGQLKKNRTVLPCRRNEIGCISRAPFIDSGQQDSRRPRGESKAQSNDGRQRETEREGDSAASKVK